MRKLRLLSLLLPLTISLSATAAQTNNPIALFQYCVACHKADGSGNKTLKAPAIAGLPHWYVVAQLQKFRSGIRGLHPKDPEGLRMKPMADALTTDAAVNAVAKRVASLPRTKIPKTVGGDAKKGKLAYALCGTCHGAKGEGNKALKAPPLKGTNDWYLLSQLKKFKAGIRGKHPKDTAGAQMAAMAASIANEATMRDLLAYINSL